MSANTQAAPNTTASTQLTYLMINRLLAGECPILVWREHRGLTEKELALGTQLTTAMIKDLEIGTLPLSIELSNRIGMSLGVDALALMPLCRKEGNKRLA